MDPAGDDILDRLFRNARSQNGWLDETLPEDALRAIWDLAKFGPTSANCSPMRVVWCVSLEARQRLAKQCSSTNGAKVLAAPATAIIGQDMKFYDKLPQLFPHTDARSWFAHSDTLASETAFRNASLQGAYLIIAARALGWDAGPISGFDAPGVDKAFFDGTDCKANFICSFGRGDPSKVLQRLPRLAFEEANRIL